MLFTSAGLCALLIFALLRNCVRMVQDYRRRKALYQDPKIRQRLDLWRLGLWQTPKEYAFYNKTHPYAIMPWVAEVLYTGMLLSGIWYLWPF